jgi:glutamate/tyrosine decarboxylase-like PLP-dependent enzyme
MEPFLDATAFTEIGQKVLAQARAFLYTERAIYTPMPPEVIASLRDAVLPAQGLSPTALLSELATVQTYPTFGTNHRRSYGWIGGGVNEWGVLASLIGAAFNPNSLGGDQAITYMELAVVRWLASLVGFPLEQGAGLLLSGGSQATLTALAAARQRMGRRLGRDLRVDGLAGLPKLVVYASDQSHSSVQQQANVLGLGEVHTIASNGRYQMEIDALRLAIQQDRRRGLLPLCAVGTCGTTSTGAIDPLDALADLCAGEDLWLHIDGAYGAFGWLDPRLRSRYQGIARADSLGVDAHKWLAAPYESGCLLVRSQQSLRDTFARPTPPYLHQVEDDHPHFSDLGLQLSRAPRALMLWVILRSLGREGIRDLVTNHRDLALELAQGIEGMAGMTVLAPVELTTVCFRYAPDALPEAQIQQCNQELLATMQHSNLAFPTATTLHKQVFALRACVLHPRTTRADIHLFLRCLQRSVERLQETQTAGA